jgi:hypothetical protein
MNVFMLKKNPISDKVNGNLKSEILNMENRGGHWENPQAHANLGVNTVETALFVQALEVVKKPPVFQVIEYRYISNIKTK